MKNLIIILITIFLTIPGFALDKQKILNDIQSVYPHFTAAEIQKKIQASPDPEDFLRSFIPYYYLTLKNNPQMAGNLISMSHEAGWCVGDAHYSNFGVIINRLGKTTFTFNDLDDAGPCPLFTDALKFFVSVKLTAPQFDFVALKNSYLLGLQGRPLPPPDEVMQMLADGERLGPVPDPKELASPTKLRRDPNGREFTQAEKSAVQGALAQAYSNKVTLTDGYSSFHTGGGSHGLQIFKTLVKSNATGYAQIVELKRQVNPGIFPLALAPIPATRERIQNTLLMEQGQDFNGYYGVQNILNNSYLLQAKWLGNIKVSPKELNQVQLYNIALYEFYVLGQIHRKSASPNYIALLTAAPPQDWEQAALTIGAYFKDVFKTVK